MIHVKFNKLLKVCDELRFNNLLLIIILIYCNKTSKHGRFILQK